MKFISLEGNRINVENITYYRQVVHTNGIYAKPSYRLFISFIGDNDALSISVDTQEELDTLTNCLDNATDVYKN